MPILADIGIEFSGEPEVFEAHNLLIILTKPADTARALLLHDGTQRPCGPATWPASG